MKICKYIVLLWQVEWVCHVGDFPSLMEVW